MIGGLLIAPPSGGLINLFSRVSEASQLPALRPPAASGCKRPAGLGRSRLLELPWQSGPYQYLTNDKIGYH